MRQIALITGTSSGVDVAEVIFVAATDGRDQLHHVATEEIKRLAKARRETSEHEYRTIMKSQFLPKSVDAKLETSA